MDECCRAEDLAKVAGQRDQRRVPVIVLAANLALFVVEMVAAVAP